MNKFGDPILIEFNIGGFSYWLFQLSGYVTLGDFSEEIIEYCSKQADYTLVNFRIR